MGSFFGAAAVTVVAMSFVTYVWGHRLASQAPAGGLPRKIRSRFAQALVQAKGGAEVMVVPAAQPGDVSKMAESLWSAIMHARGYGQHAVADSLAMTLALEMYRRGAAL